MDISYHDWWIGKFGRFEPARRAKFVPNCLSFINRYRVAFGIASNQINFSTLPITEAAPSVQPRAVEQPVEGEIAGVKVRGIVDVLDVTGCVLDLKTASKRPHGVTVEYGLQLTTYAMITPGASGSCRLDTVTKTKTAQVIQQTYKVGQEERRFAETLYPMVQDSIRDGIYPPHRGSPLCSRRHCGYWRECEREFSGRVPE